MALPILLAAGRLFGAAASPAARKAARQKAIKVAKSSPAGAKYKQVEIPKSWHPTPKDFPAAVGEKGYAPGARNPVKTKETIGAKVIRAMRSNETSGGRYEDNEEQIGQMSRGKRVARSMMNMVTGNNSLARRLFDDFAAKKSPLDGLESKERGQPESKFKPQIPEGKQPPPPKYTPADAPDNMSSKIISKLDEIKAAILGTGTREKSTENSATAKMITQLAEKFGKKLIKSDNVKDAVAKITKSLLKQSTPKPAFKIQKTFDPKSLPVTRVDPKKVGFSEALKNASNPLVERASTVLEKVQNIAGKILAPTPKKMPVIPTGRDMAKLTTVQRAAPVAGRAAGGAVMSMGALPASSPGMFSRILGGAGSLLRLGGLGAAAAVGGAGYLGYKGGQAINRKMDEAAEGTVLNKAKKVKDSIADTTLSGIDKATSGGISGSKVGADQMWKESGGNKVVETLEGLYGKKKSASKNIQELAPKLIRNLEDQGITSPKQQSMVMGQLAVESSGFNKMEEGKYSADNVWKLRGKQLEDMGVKKDELISAQKSGGSDAMYEYMYSDKYRKGSSRLGNDEEGDGAKYKGRGMIQLTGKKNYAEAGRELGLDLTGNPDLVKDDPDVNAKVTAWYLKKNKMAQKSIEKGDVVGLSKAINGGTHGLDSRISETDKIMAALGGDTSTSGLQSSALAGISKKSGTALLAKNAVKKVDTTTSTALEIMSEDKAKRNSQPIVIAQAPAQGDSRGVTATPTGRQSNVTTITPRNPDSTIKSITAGIMSYGAT